MPSPDLARRAVVTGLGAITPIGNDAPAAGRGPESEEVEEALTDTFPASDPPPFSGGRATADSGRTEPELPDPRDVP